MNVFQTIAAVKADLGAVDKNGKMTAGPAKYSYRGIDDVINALHVPLVTHGLVIAPKLRSMEQVYGQGSNGNQTRTLVEFEWTVAGPEGDSFIAATSGEAMDTQDKGSNKAGTAAYKQLLCQLLAIPFQTEDPDNFHPDTEASKTPAKAAASSKPAAADKGPEVSGNAAPAASGPVARTCETCTYAIGASDPIKRKAGKYHHKACLEGGTPATVTPAADDITSIIDQYEGN